ncbi:MAG TPA: hypothetical protein VN018_01200 [Brevundimonas sp.]|nr:hypothetical protein [Brevundimonas sp.]
MIGLLAATALMAATQVPAAATPPQDPPVTQIEDVVVTGRRLDQMIEQFVDEVAEPNNYRGLARWNRSLCVGVANLRPETAQYIVDRVSTVAEDVGLNPGNPGCRPNLLIVATEDGEAVARTMVTEREKDFRMGGTGMDRGRAALIDFQETDRPIRWWQVSLPVDSETGARAVRLPGDCQPPACAQSEGNVLGYAPVTNVSSASRLRTDFVDDIFRTVVIVDIDEVAGLTALQLADYIAMVALAQINPNADTRGFGTILNVFADSAAVPTLTEWDLAYLQGLYGAEQTDRNRAAGRREVEASIRRAHAQAGSATQE